MRSVVILGSNGYVGNYLSQVLSDKYVVYPINRSKVDLCNLNEVFTLFKSNNFDVVINCAGNLKSNLDFFDQKVYLDNLSIFHNLLSMKQFFGKLINFGSGAEFDRQYNIENASEDSISYTFPKDHYGKSKNLISRMCNNIDNFYTLRLFGVFSSNEPKHRLLKMLLQSDSFEIQDRYFDYFFLEDILPVVEYYINEDNIYKDINLCYSEKIKLSEFVNRFIKFNSLNKQIKTSNVEVNYTGDSTRLDSLKLPFKGINYGLRNYL